MQGLCYHQEVPQALDLLLGTIGFGAYGRSIGLLVVLGVSYREGSYKPNPKEPSMA